MYTIFAIVTIALIFTLSTIIYNKIVWAEKIYKLPPTRMLFLTLLGTLLIVVIFNLITWKDVEPYTITASDLETTQQNEMDYNTKSGYKNYDMKFNSNGNYAIVYSDDDYACYTLQDSLCESNALIGSSKIAYFDNNNTELWSIQSSEAGIEDMVLTNIIFHGIAIEQLNNTNLVSIGYTVDSTTREHGVGIVEFDDSGNEIQVKNIDVSDYGITTHSGHVYMDVVKTADNGFTVRYFDVFYGAVIIHFNEDLEDMWNYPILDDAYLGNPVNEDLEALQVYNDQNIVVMRDTLFSIDMNGNFNWKSDIDTSIYALFTNEEEILAIQYDSLNLYEQESIVTVKDKEDIIIYFNIISFDPNTGEISSLSSFHFKQILIVNPEIGLMTPIAKEIVKDEEGNYYIIAFDRSSQLNLEYNIMLVKFNPSGAFVGIEYFNNEFESSYYTLDDSKYRNSPVIENGILHLYIPTISNHIKLDLNNLDFDGEMPINVNVDGYNNLTSYRVALNTSFLVIIVIITGYAIISPRLSKNQDNEESVS